MMPLVDSLALVRENSIDLQFGPQTIPLQPHAMDTCGNEC